MMNEMSGEQFMAWVAYAELEPFGEERADLRSGIVASVIANVNRDPKKGKAYSPSDFIPKFGAEKKVAPTTDVAKWKSFRDGMKAGLVPLES